MSHWRGFGPLRGYASAGIRSNAAETLQFCEADLMRSGPAPARAEDDLFSQELGNIINMRIELGLLDVLFAWSIFDQKFGTEFESAIGCLAQPTRLVPGLLYLKRVYAPSDKAVVERWVESHYSQHFDGERYFHHEMPRGPSSLMRWTKRVGDAGADWLLPQMIKVPRASGTIAQPSLSTIVVDTTVQPKAIAYPTDSHLLDRPRQHLAYTAQAYGIELRSRYARLGPQTAHQAGRYASARQFHRRIGGATLQALRLAPASDPRFGAQSSGRHGARYPSSAACAGQPVLRAAA
jgi:IS5 family transposase